MRIEVGERTQQKCFPDTRRSGKGDAFSGLYPQADGTPVVEFDRIDSQAAQDRLLVGKPGLMDVEPDDSVRRV
jgi:hypothetical protein